MESRRILIQGFAVFNGKFPGIGIRVFLAFFCLRFQQFPPFCRVCPAFFGGCFHQKVSAHRPAVIDADFFQGIFFSVDKSTAESIAQLRIFIRKRSPFSNSSTPDRIFLYFLRAFFITSAGFRSSNDFESYFLNVPLKPVHISL